MNIGQAKESKLLVKDENLVLQKSEAEEVKTRETGSVTRV